MYVLANFVLLTVYSVRTCMLTLLWSGRFFFAANTVHVFNYIQLQLEFPLMFLSLSLSLLIVMKIEVVHSKAKSLF